MSVLSIVPVHSDVPEECHLVAGGSTPVEEASTPVEEALAIVREEWSAERIKSLEEWSAAQIKILRKLGGCSERTPTTRTNDEGIHSDVSTPKCRIEIDDEQMLKAPFRRIIPPMKDFLDLKVWNPVISWYEWHVPCERVSGYMFDQGTVWLYTRHDCELFVEAHTPYIQFHAKDWAYFRNIICKELTSVENCMDGAYIAQWNGSINGEIYRVETVSPVYDPTSHILFRQCMDNTVIHKARKGTPHEGIQYPLTFIEWGAWFDKEFVVKWSTWRRTLDVFEQIDDLFKMHELHKTYDDLKIRLFNENHDDDDEMDDTALIYTVERMEERIRCF